MADAPIQFIDLAAQQQRLTGLREAIDRVLSHGKYIMGPEVVELESQLASFAGAKHAVSCASGTDALLLDLLAHCIGPGDAVLVPTFTFVSTAEVVVLAGATPVFVDVDPDYFLMDVEGTQAAVEQARQAGLRPRAIMPVDLFGLPADYPAFNRIADDSDMVVIADAAQGFGGERDGKRAGTMAHSTCTSFFPAKPLGCYGDGGAVFTDDDEFADRLRSLRIHGKGTDKYDNVRIGINGRLDTLQAAILIEKMKLFPDEIVARNRVADSYDELLPDSVVTPKRLDGATSVWAQYTLKLENRDGFATKMKENGVPTAVYYPRPLHEQTAYARFHEGKAPLPTSERLKEEVVSLPMHPYLDRATIERIVAPIRSL